MRLRIALAAVSAVGAAGMVGFWPSGAGRAVGVVVFVAALAYIAQALRDVRS